MRTSDDGSPLVHRVTTDAQIMRESREGLDVLLKRSSAIQSRDARERAARLLEEESEAVRQRKIRQAQLLAERFEWRPVAAVAIFECQACKTCGHFHYVFRGFATRMERKADTIKRLASAECLDRGLPFERELMATQVPVCVDCLDKYVGQPGEPSHTYVPLRSGE